MAYSRAGLLHSRWMDGTELKSTPLKKWSHFEGLI